MIRALLHSADRFVEHAGGWSIMALDGILLIPLAFAGFFFPVAFAIGLGSALALAIAVGLVVRAVHAHHHPHGVG